MEKSTISVTIDQNLNNNFKKMCQDLGISVSNAISLFMKTVVKEKRLPAEMAFATSGSCDKGLWALQEMRTIIAQSGKPEPTLEEINAMIKEVRDAK